MSQRINNSSSYGANETKHKKNIKRDDLTSNKKRRVCWHFREMKSCAITHRSVMSIVFKMKRTKVNGKQ